MELSKRERKKLRTLKKGIRSELAFCPILLENIEEIIFKDPEDVNSRVQWIVLSKRLGNKIPETILEIKETFKSKELIESYIAAMTVVGFSDPSYCACYMVRYYHSSAKWAEKIIGNDKTGNPSYYAYMMVVNDHSSSEWAEKVIENAVSGNPSWFAYTMVNDHHSSAKWAEKVIENDKTGCPSGAAYMMVEAGYSSAKWYKEITGEDYRE